MTSPEVEEIARKLAIIKAITDEGKRLEAELRPRIAALIEPGEPLKTGYGTVSRAAIKPVKKYDVDMPGDLAASRAWAVTKPAAGFAA